MAQRRPNRRRTKASLNYPQTPVTDGFKWLFGTASDDAADEESQRLRKTKREEDAKRRTEGFEWLFK